MNTASIRTFPKGDPRGVCIARWAPMWTGRRYEPLYPPHDLLRAYRDFRIDWIVFAAGYKRRVLAELDARRVYAELGPEAVLLCFEPAGEHCHRRLVAAWLEQEIGIEVPELGSVA
jgi:hypothetical protein